MASYSRQKADEPEDGASLPPTSYCPFSPSWQARCLGFVIYLVAYRSRNADPEWFLNHVKSTWRSCNANVVLSEDSRADYSEEVLQNGKHAWQVFHIRPKRRLHSQKRVILYWHGGGFHTRTPSLDSRAVLTMALDTGCPVIYPLYTLAPVGTAAECITGGLRLLLEISQDDRYRDHKIIVTGASAGAWIALRLVLALAQCAMGKSTVRSPPSPRVDGTAADQSIITLMDSSAAMNTARRIREVVLQSPWVDTDLKHPEDRDIHSKDVLLNPITLRMSAEIWAYGAVEAFPDFDFGLPSDHAIDRAPNQPDKKPLIDPAYSPMYGIDVLRALYEYDCTIRVSQYIGTEDLFYPQNLRLERSLTECGIPHTTRIYSGVGHILGAHFLPECHDMFADLNARMRGEED